MMKKLKELFSKTWFKSILYVMGVLAVLEWIIFPLLTVSSTLLNALGAFLAIIVIGLSINMVSETFRKPEETKETEEND